MSFVVYTDIVTSRLTTFARMYDYSFEEAVMQLDLQHESCWSCGHYVNLIDDLCKTEYGPAFHCPACVKVRLAEARQRAARRAPERRLRTSRQRAELGSGPPSAAEESPATTTREAP
jgi:hypothetical protein